MNTTIIKSELARAAFKILFVAYHMPVLWIITIILNYFSKHPVAASLTV